MRNTLGILKELIAIPSYVSGESTESALIKYIKQFTKNNRPDLKIIEQHVERDRYNLYISTSSNPKILLFGHMDTVFPKSETIEPFTPKIKENKLYGLGAVDMKSGLAIMLDIMKNNHMNDVGYVFTVDEEYEFKGAKKLRENFPFKPKLILNVEPTDLKILNGCRGITEFSFSVYGKSVHAGRKEYGVNAIEQGVTLVDLFQKEISKYNTDLRGKSTINLAYIHGGVLRDFDKNGNPIISGIGNVVPNYAKLNCEIRIASEEIDKDYIEKEFVEIAKKLNTKVSDFKFNFYYGSMITDKKNLKDFEKAFESVGLKPQYGDISNAGYYEVQIIQEETGCDCVVFGPGPIAESHSANEYVDIQTIETCQSVIEFYIKSLVSS